MSIRSTMGQSSNKFSKIDNAVQNLGSLQKRGKQLARDITELFREMDNHTYTLKSEKEFLAREIQSNEKGTTSYSFKDKKLSFNESSTQTEADEEVTLSVVNETLSDRNRELEVKVLALEERLKQEGTSKGNILSAVACNFLLPPSGDDKYIPSGTEQQEQLQLLQIEYDQVLKDKDCLNAEIKRLGEDLIQEKLGYRSNEDQAKERIKNLEEQILVLKRQLTEKINETSTIRDEMCKDKNENEILKRDKIELDQTNICIRLEMGKKMNRIAQLQNKVTELEQQVDQSRILLDKKSVEYSSRFEQQNTDSVRIQGMLGSKDKQLNEKVKQVNTLEREKHDLENKIREYRTECSDHIQQIEQKDRMVAEMEHKLLQTVNQNDMVIDERKREIEKLTLELNHKETELSHLRHETDESVKKIKNELSLEAVKSQNSKKENDVLRRTILGLEDEISDLKLTYNKLETDLEIKEANITQERSKLRNEIAELLNIEISLKKDYATLVRKCHTLEQEIEKITTKERNKKYVSFHCVLKQPQSDQAISGIVSLLQQKFEDVDIEIVPESKRSKNVPLFVVLYNLSRLTDDATGALIGIEASPDVALVVLHSKEIKKASDQVLTLPGFKKLGIIVDMSFISAKGLIHNEPTANAVNQLAKYLNKY